MIAVACSLMMLIPIECNLFELLIHFFTLKSYLQMIPDVYRSLQVIAVACIMFIIYRRVIGVAFYCKEFYPLASPDIFSNPRLNLFRNSSSKCVFRRELPVTRRYYRLMRLYICHYVYAR